MIKKLKSISIKTAAIALAVLMVFSILPISELVAVASGDSDTFYVSVKDEDTYAPISGATVTLTPQEGTDIEELSSVATDSQGIAKFTAISQYFDSLKPSFDLKYSVTADDYEEVIDEEFTVSADTISIDVTMVPTDNTKPTITQVDGIPEEWTNETVTVSVDAEDVGRGVSQYRIGSEAWQTGKTFTIYENGDYTVYAKDKSGNISEGYDFSINYIDTDAPAISSFVIDPDTWTHEEVSLSVIASDSGSGIKDYKMDDGEWQSSNIFTVGDNETHTFYVRDFLNQESSKTETVDKFDNVKPVISDVTCPDNWSNSYIEYTVNTSDDKSGVAQYGIALTSEKDEVSNISWVENTENENIFKIYDTELYSFFVKDNAGNISLAYDMTAPAKIEKIAPVISDVTLSTEDWTNQPITFTVVAADEEGGSGIKEYSTDGTTWQEGNEFVFADKEEHKFFVKDNAGNVSVAFAKTASNYDDIAPIISNVTLSTEEWTNQPITFTVIAEDEEDGSGIKEYSTDAETWQAEKKFSISDNNEHNFYVKDNAGNVSLAFVESASNFDAKAPELSNVDFKLTNNAPIFTVLNYLTFGVFFNKDEKITISAEDNTDEKSSASGISTYIVRFKDTLGNVVKEVNGADNTVKFDYDEIENFKGSVFVEIIDNANNSSDEIQINDLNSNLPETSFMIENDAPIISVTPDDTYYQKTVEDDSYLIFSNDFNVLFSAEDSQEGKEVSGINYALVKVNGVKVSLEDNADETTGSYAQKFENSLPVDLENKRVNETAFGDNWNKGVLEFTFYAVDNAGTAAEEETRTYYIDETAPVISGFDFTPAGNMDVDKKDSLYSAVDVTDYGFFFKKNVVVTVKADDIVGDDETIASGVKSITWYTEDVVTNEITEPLTVDVDEDNCISFEISKDFKGQIYAWATDNNSNQDKENGCAHPNGSVLETPQHHKEEKDHIVITTPKTNYTQNNGVALYSEDVKVDIAVKDEYAGIREIKWNVSAEYDTKNNYSGKLNVDNDGKTISYEGDGKENDWKIVKSKNDINLATLIKNTIKVSNNSNDITVTVELTDRAGNKSSDSIKFGIDKTKPTIEVTYDNNTTDEKYTDYYKENRTATIVITERNFRADDVDFGITNTDGWIPSVNLNSESAWKTVKDSANPDRITHTATITYSQDGDFTFRIDYKDNANNKAVGYNGSFTIDKTIPRVIVVYNNNSAQNGNYYNADRIATITIEEHNFDPSRVTIIGTANEADFPTLSAWSTSGNIHTATLSYTKDSLYTFDIEFIDMAGNSIDDYSVEEFTVDKTMPVLEISGIVDESANSGSENIGFVISATDTNFDEFAPVITAIRYTEGTFVTEAIDPGSKSSIANGQQYVVNNIDTDGIYKITCTVVDKAGNAFDKVVLEDVNGIKYNTDRKGNDVLLTFSVNRNGSVFYVEGYTEDTIDKYYVQNITEDIQINEINADAIIDKDVVVNGKNLSLDRDYTVSLDKGEGTWYRYTYSVKKDVFESEGEYSIVVSSKDKANNLAYSDVKKVSADFIVDRTAPVVTLAGLKTNGRYRTDKQIITVVPKDDGGMLKSLTIRTVDDNGSTLKELVSLDGESLTEAVETDKITFELGEGLYQNVLIICEDAAGNITGENSSGELYENVSVSTSAFLIFWANRVARYTTLAGIVAVSAAAVAFPIFKRKRGIPSKGGESNKE